MNPEQPNNQRCNSVAKVRLPHCRSPPTGGVTIWENRHRGGIVTVVAVPRIAGMHGRDNTVIKIL